eukprot:364532-Chlamydomonas_euryale.AAC.1
MEPKPPPGGGGGGPSAGGRIANITVMRTVSVGPSVGSGSSGGSVGRAPGQQPLPRVVGGGGGERHVLGGMPHRRQMLVPLEPKS